MLRACGVGYLSPSADIILALGGCVDELPAGVVFHYTLVQVLGHACKYVASWSASGQLGFLKGT